MGKTVTSVDKASKLKYKIDKSLGSRKQFKDPVTEVQASDLFAFAANEPSRGSSHSSRMGKSCCSTGKIGLTIRTV